MTGKLILCATPIGNLGDITGRVLDALKEADVIAAEDTRNTIKLLNHFEIKTPMTSYHEFNKIEKGHALVTSMLAGKTVALVTDAGTPGISDPGEELVKFCHEAGVPVTSLPGPAACITALTMSGRVTRRFCFEGFLPMDKKERAAALERLKNDTRTTIFYEAPHRLLKTLKAFYEVIGNRPLTICKELTKKHETVWMTTLEEAIAHYEAESPRGEYVLIFEGEDPEVLKAKEIAAWDQMTIGAHVMMYMNSGSSKKEAMKLAATDRGMTKREVYQYLLEHPEELDG